MLTWQWRLQRLAYLILESHHGRIRAAGQGPRVCVPLRCYLEMPVATTESACGHFLDYAMIITSRVEDDSGLFGNTTVTLKRDLFCSFDRSRKMTRYRQLDKATAAGDKAASVFCLRDARVPSTRIYIRSLCQGRSKT